MLTLALGHVWRASPEALLIQCNKVSKLYRISKCTTGSCSSVASRRKHLLHNRHAHPSGTWQPNFFECSTTTSRMTAGTIFETPLLPSSPMPPLWAVNHNTLDKCHVRLYSTKPQGTPETDENHNETKTLSQPKDETSIQVEEKEEKLSLVQKFKLMYKQYWYVLIPVHVVTSIVWYGSFFLAAKSGVDIVPVMEKLGAGEKILSHLRTSDAGYYAIAYAMYKIATPARYTVTIGGTTISINYLKKHGYIKPVPSKEKLKEIYEGKKEEYKERTEEIKEKLQEKKEEIKERREEIKEKLQEKKEEMKERVQERTDEIYEKVQERKDEIKEKLQDRKEKLDDMRKSIIGRRKED